VLSIKQIYNKMKQGLIVFLVLCLLSSCCDILCERQKHAEMIIEKVEAYRQETGELPEKLQNLALMTIKCIFPFIKK